MPVEMTYQLNELDVARWQNAVMRNSVKFGQTAKSSLAWGMMNVTKSLGAQTPVSKKIRPIVENPNWNNDPDYSKGRYGVMKYSQKLPQPYFKPIRGSRAGNKIRFVSRTTGEVLERDMTTGEVHRIDTQGAGHLDLFDIQNHKQRKIGRSGFAKKAWKYLGIKTLAGGLIYVDGIPNMGEIKWSDSNKTIQLNNKVSYTQRILKGGAMAVNMALQKATASMLYKINGNIKKELQKAA